MTKSFERLSTVMSKLVSLLCLALLIHISCEAKISNRETTAIVFQRLELPRIIYGTAWKNDNTKNLVVKALHAGFRAIDTACQPKHYNELGVGEVLSLWS